MTTFGTGTFGSNIITFDGNDIDPVDITTVEVDYLPAVTVAGSFDVFTAEVEHAPSLSVAATHATSITSNVAHAPSVSLSASHDPSIEKGGTP
jgi:hypothetical protein